MSFDAHKNFAYSTVATAPSPATSGTSLVVASGDGSKFPAAPFNAVIWPAGAQPSDANAEVVRVTNISGDTPTIVRAQEGSSARTVVVGDQIAATATAKVFTDIEAAIPSVPVSSVFTRTGAVVAADGDYEGVVAAALSGATAAARFVGATTSGAPVSGTFLKGDFIVAQNGHIFICTTAGSPGTWTDAGSVANLVSSVFGRAGTVVATSGDYTAAQVTNAADKSSSSQQAFTGEVAAPDFAPSGLTGAASASRYVGATSSGAPASGTFAVGDFVVARNGHIFVCTGAGTPGTWVDVGSVSNLVTSVFGRAGAVVAAANDYILDQIGPATADYSVNSHKLTNVADPTSGQDAATKHYVEANVGTTAGAGFYGDGSDGTVTFDGTTTVLGIVPSPSSNVNGVYTLTRDIFLAAATLNSGISIITNGFRIFCSGTFTNNGTIKWNGNNGSAASGGAQVSNTGASTISTAAVGSSGGSGSSTTGGNGNAAATSINYGGQGGHGGSGTGGAGGTGGTTIAAPAKVSSIRFLPLAVLGIGVSGDGTVSTSFRSAGGTGGGAGGGDASNSGGGGGSGGGIVIVAAKTFAGTGVIQARGGDGVTPAGGNTGGGGGGGGGLVIVISSSVSSGAISGQTIDANGGAHGSAHGTGPNALVTDGSAGTVILLAN